MAEFTVNVGRLDPYKNFKFRVKWDNAYVAGVNHVSGLVRTTDVVPSRGGGEPSQEHLAPGLTRHAPIVLSRGRTHDTAFEEWANKVWTLGAGLGSEVSLADFRKNITLELYNEAGQLVMAWHVHRCWPSEYVALSPLDADDSALVIESLTLQNEGWERDLAVTEPKEPTTTEP